MEKLREIKIEEISGAWIITKDGKSYAYSQLPVTKDYKRLVKDLLKHLELSNLLEIREI